MKYCMLYMLMNAYNTSLFYHILEGYHYSVDLTSKLKGKIGKLQFD